MTRAVQPDLKAEIVRVEVGSHKQLEGLPQCLSRKPPNVRCPRREDNTQWLILKAQELWPQHQQQARRADRPFQT